MKTTRVQRATTTLVRNVLTGAIAVVLAVFGLWDWAWLSLGFAAFTEIAGIGFVLTESLRSREAHE